MENTKTLDIACYVFMFSCFPYIYMQENGKRLRVKRELPVNCIIAIIFRIAVTGKINHFAGLRNRLCTNF